jgi:hypothetical protein
MTAEAATVLTISDFYNKPSWMLEGNCLGLVDESEDGSIMYPDRSNGDVAFAKSICNGAPAKPAKMKNGSVVVPAQRARRECPVKEECLEYALAHGERWGVWGGKSERERRYLQRARKKALRTKGVAKKIPGKTVAVTKVSVRKPKTK